MSCGVGCSHGMDLALQLASSCSSDLTPCLGTSICHGCSPKNNNKTITTTTKSNLATYLSPLSSPQNTLNSNWEKLLLHIYIIFLLHYFKVPTILFPPSTSSHIRTLQWPSISHGAKSEDQSQPARPYPPSSLTPLFIAHSTVPFPPPFCSLNMVTCSFMAFLLFISSAWNILSYTFTWIIPLLPFRCLLRSPLYQRSSLAFIYKRASHACSALLLLLYPSLFLPQHLSPIFFIADIFLLYMYILCVYSFLPFPTTRIYAP